MRATRPAVQNGGYASSRGCQVTCVCDRGPRRAHGRRSRGGQRLGARLTAGRARRKASGRRCEVRADPPGLGQRCRKCMRPQIPGLSPGGLGPHHTSSGFPCGLSSGFPVARRVLLLRPPSLRPAFSGCSLRPLPGSGSPSVSLRVPFPLSNLHVSAAAARFRRRWSRAAGTKVIRSAATTSPGSRDPPALQMGATAGHDGISPRGPARCNSMAWRISTRRVSSVSASATQPGRSGHHAP